MPIAHSQSALDSRQGFLMQFTIFFLYLSKDSHQYFAEAATLVYDVVIGLSFKASEERVLQE